jgi:molecular chaperone HscB
MLGQSKAMCIISIVFERLFHSTPDPQKKYDIAASLSSLVNTAYKTLRQPLLRVEYILSQHDLQTNETDGLEDSELIMDVLESREALEQASSRAEVDLVQSANQGFSASFRSSFFSHSSVSAKMDELLGQIENFVEEEDWINLKTAAIKLKYLQGIADAADAWPNRVFDH